ncbi:hypothetical protein QR98_0022870 [Sarcoptes scabiei]|uniref:DUF7045 domain-containing protein n=1 Tax=Sarcoptes scabiei TaxID=52283 RepID=A0A132A0H9_SARSC|nr:hypothetical protein QR98_0022870 [Sarcoptes scabiei]
MKCNEKNNGTNYQTLFNSNFKLFSQREYRCLGNWEEDGILYTFTQRRDMPGHQCFAGKIYRNGDEAYIKEAGESCMRYVDDWCISKKKKKKKKHSIFFKCPRICSQIDLELKSNIESIIQ